MKTFKLSTQTVFLIRRVTSALAVIFSASLIVAIILSGLLPLKYLLISIAIIIVLDAFALAMLLRSKKRNRARAIGYLIAVMMIIMSIGGLYGLSNSLNLLNQVTGNSAIKKKDIDNTKPFNVYISGIDTWGDISTVSRSDVNIVATINPTTKRILLTTIPRDSYVPIAGGGNNQYDKLTHAGNYGVESSMQTVANLLDSKIDNYIRINFTSFMKMIDGIGGITVANPVTFTTDDGHVYKQGNLYLMGEDALQFSRERHNLDGGDNDRGKNQERVITAIFNKLMSPSVIYHYQNVLSVIGDSVQTNISPKSITALINQQIDSGASWKVESTDISGKGQTGGLPSYAMPSSQLYMFVIDQTSLQQTKERIKAAIRV
ncbi:MAG: eps5A [Candidatus Saccharibacteria bacterium]|nr:eps5A [Candidatus Saccharibacteria bacterium]